MREVMKGIPARVTIRCTPANDLYGYFSYLFSVRVMKALAIPKRLNNYNTGYFTNCMNVKCSTIEGWRYDKQQNFSASSHKKIGRGGKM